MITLQLKNRAISKMKLAIYLHQSLFVKLYYLYGFFPKRTYYDQITNQINYE